ncbi:hypothetical protein Aduo_016791 [Ancylostoma duodenale]
MDAFLGFEDDPKFFVSAMYLSTLHSVPLFFVAVYCIIRVSPPKMGRYKWWLLYHVVTSFTGEIALNCGAIPVLYLPVVGGYPRGLFWTLGMPTITMLALMTTIFLENGCKKSSNQYFVKLIPSQQCLAMAMSQLCHELSYEDDLVLKSLDHPSFRQALTIPENQI